MGSLEDNLEQHFWYNSCVAICYKMKIFLCIMMIGFVMLQGFEKDPRDDSEEASNPKLRTLGRGHGDCMPEYGRYPSDQSSNLGKTGSVKSWQECGLLCYNNLKCYSWSWNTPFNQCAHVNGKGCNICQLWSKTKATVRNADWISGSWTCFSGKS